MNIAFCTSNHARHKYFASEIAKSLSLKLILCEEKSAAIEAVSNYNESDQQLLNQHFKDRAASENLFFGVYADFPVGIKKVDMDFGAINSQQTLDLLRENEIDCILLFGTSIIKDMILEQYPLKVINLHLGLSPYYKGSGTNFFPIVNNEFECIGATIHLAIDTVDAGAILHQFRPDTIEADDDIHSLGNKLIEKAGKIYPKIAADYLSGKIIPQPQENATGSKVYRIKDFTPETLKAAHKVINNGGVADFLKNKTKRLASKPIVSNEK